MSSPRITESQHFGAGAQSLDFLILEFIDLLIQIWPYHREFHESINESINFLIGFIELLIQSFGFPDIGIISSSMCPFVENENRITSVFHRSTTMFISYLN